MIRFSIVLPVRNGGELLRLCVNNILMQEYKEFDLLVLDNNSSDGTYEWIRSIPDDRIRIYRSDHDLSITENWARILTIPKNEFMTITGHDDIFHPDYLQKMNEVIHRYPNASLYQAHFNFIDSGGNLVKPCQPMPETMQVQDFLEAEFLRRMDSMGTGYMMRSADYDRLGGIDCTYPNLIFADYQLWTELTGLVFLAISPEICFSYRLHNSLSKTTDAESYRIAFEMYIDFLGRYAYDRPLVMTMIKEKGGIFMNYFCESLSHRLLKSPDIPQRMPLRHFIRNCKKKAQLLGIEDFRPYRNFRILMAYIFDRSIIFRRLFMCLKRSGILNFIA